MQNMMVGYFQRQNLNFEIKDISHKQMVQLTIKVSPKAFKGYHLHKCIQKKLNITSRCYNITATMAYVTRYQHLLNSCDGHTNAFLMKN
jgi:hypothetical protein